jgi:hypothetical protein
MTRGRVVALSLCAIIVAAAAAFGSRNYLLNRKLNALQKQFREIRVGIESEFVDNCGETPANDRNLFPLQLTTPIQYVKPEFRRDPFGKAGEPLRYYNQPGRGNGTMYVFASRGPDGVLDLSNLPLKHRMWRPIGPGEVPGADREKCQVKIEGKRVTEDFFYAYRDGVEYVIGPTGKRIDNTSITVQILPRFDAVTHRGNLDDLRTYLLENGCIIYDPTNGLRSRGDIIAHNFQ